MTLTFRNVCGTAGTGAVTVLAAGIMLATATAQAQPIVDTGPGGEVAISAPPGQWWKCALYDGLPPRVTGLPPVVTSATTAQFPSGTVVLVDCASTYAPIIWLQLLRTE
ncbi:hypothetical protein [Nocardia heshunensis]